MSTCVRRLPQVHASLRQFKKNSFQCSLARAPVLRRTILGLTCVDLRWVPKRWKTCVHLRTKLSSIKMNASHRKPSQVPTSHGQTESQVNATTCDSVWLGPYILILTQVLTLIFFNFPKTLQPPPPSFLFFSRLGPCWMMLNDSK